LTDAEARTPVAAAESSFDRERRRALRMQPYLDRAYYWIVVPGIVTALSALMASAMLTLVE